MNHYKSKTILIIGGGLLQIPMIETALSMKLRVVVADMNPEAPGFKLAHEKIIMSTKDIEGMVREAKKFSEKSTIHAVITAGTDASMTVAAVANSLSLPGIRYIDAEACSNKVKMRKRLQEFNVPIPKFAPVWSIQDARDSLDFLNFPLVMKPSDNMGARGVIKVTNREELHSAFKHSKKYSPTGEMILEEYMEGPELSVDSLSWNGKIKMTGIADRIIEREPYFIETGHTMPSQFSKEIIDEVERIMVLGIKALGITLGAAKGDIKVTKDGVKVGEIAARLSGGFMSAYTYPYSTGVNLNRAAIQIAFGEEPDELDETLDLVSIERAIIANPGKIISISGVEEASEIQGVNHIFMQSQIGDIINEPTNNIEKSGHVIITAKSLLEAESIFQKVSKQVIIETDNYYSLTEKSINQTARQKFGKEICWVCKVCDGTDCASGVPGMGGVGKMETFKDNIQALKEYTILPTYIREQVEVNTEYNFLGMKLSSPMMAAPMTGATTNMNNAIDEYTYAYTVIKGSLESGSIAWLGDGATPDKYLTILNALDQFEGRGVLICKPRADEGLLKERFYESEKRGVFALGMDIDAYNFKTLIQKNQQSPSRTIQQIQKIRSLTKLPFIIKGIMNSKDAEYALEAGASGIVVSNHGGRILDEMPGTVRVLNNIVEKIQGRIPVYVDGGIRSGMDIFKMLALGAEAVLVGRPVAIHAVGGEVAGVKFLYNQYIQELKNTMNIAAASKLVDIKKEMILKK